MDICQILGDKGFEKALEYYTEEELKSIIERLELEKLLKIPGFGKKKYFKFKKKLLKSSLEKNTKMSFLVMLGKFMKR